MLRLAYLGVAAVLAAGAAGCNLNLGDDGGDDACNYDDVPQSGSEDSLEAPAPELLNPETLQCEPQTYGGCDPCYDECDATADQADPIPPKTWAYCGTGCEGLAELDCLAATECRATYDHGCYTGDGPCTAEVPYLGCYGVDMTGPIEGGGCTGLGAQDCSRHNDCLALHSTQCAGEECWQQFVECRDEVRATCYGPVSCDSLPPPCTDDSVPGVWNGCWTGTCIPVSECEPVCDETDCG
jgi:hypothetical protein